MNMIKRLLIVLGITILAMPNIVNAASAPYYDSEKDIFVANGTAITIDEKDGVTVATWEGGEQELTANTLVIGGEYNSCTEATCELDYESTSITMNGGTVGDIVGGHVIDKDYANYSKIHVGTINVTVNGGTVDEISAVTGANEKVNTALGSSYYENIKEFYYADTVNITVKNATVESRIYVLSSYTYAKDVIITIENATVHEGYYALAVGTNGVVDNFTANIKDSTVDQIHSGFRTMVENMTINITGTSTIGDIYAGSYYALTEQSTQSWWSTNIGYVDYGQVAKMEFNIDENVTYNNIYAGFQFATVNGKSELETFKEVYAGNPALETYAKGFENANLAPLVINIKSVPSVTDSGLVSMISEYTAENVVVNYTPVSNNDEIDTSVEVDVPTPGIIDKEEVDTVLEESTTNNETILDEVAQGNEVTVEVVSTPITSPADTTIFEDKLANNETILGYFDVSILIISNGVNEVGKISELTSPISMAIVLPSSFTPVAEGYVRTYYVLREHNGQVEKLPASLSVDGKTVVFESDKFSEYALVYTDTLIETEIEVPNTIDNIGTVILVNIIFVAGFIFAVYKARKSFSE